MKRTLSLLHRYGIAICLTLTLSAGKVPAQTAGNTVLNRLDSLLQKSDAGAAISTGTSALMNENTRLDKKSKMTIHRKLAGAYKIISNQIQELYHLQKALSYAEVFGTETDKAEAFRALGRFYLHINAEKSDSLLRLASQYFQSSGDNAGLAECTSNLGQVAYVKNNPEEALRLFLKASRMADSLNLTGHQIRNLGRLSYVYEALGRFSDQRNAVKKQLELAGDQVSPDELSDILTDLALAEINLGNLSSAEKILDSALVVARKTGALERSRYIFHALARIRKIQENHTDYIKYLDSAHTIDDKINQTNFINQIRNMEIQLDLNRKEHENEQLRRQAELQNLTWIIVVSFLILTGVYLIILFRNQKRSATELEQQNLVILNQQEELKSALASLKISQDHFKTLFDLSPVGIMIESTEGVILDVNKNVCALTGFSREELIGTSVTRFVGPDQQDQVRQNLDRLRRGELLRNETTSVNRDGSIAHLELTEVRIDLQDGSSRILVISQDITGRKQTEAALLKAKEEAEAASKAKSSFLAMVSHEIRTPLNGIMGMAGLLLASKLTEDQKENTRIILTSGQNLMTIINDILDYSRIEAGKMDLQISRFQIRQIVSEVFSLVSTQGKNLQLHSAIPDSVPAQMIGDPARIRQILFNLVGNAVKFTESGSVEVRMEAEQEEGNRLILTGLVSDTGIGIPDDRLDRLFKPFSQVDDFSTRRFQGTGLGLKIVADLVRMMDGTISVESNPGSGSRFRFSLRLSVPENPDENLAPSEPNPEINADLSRILPLQILVAEDNPVNRKVIRKTLEKLGYSPEFAGTGAEAVRMACRQKFNLILMDVQMPEMDGIEATREIRRTAAFQPVIIALTAHAQSQDQEACLAAGMNDFISKPFQLGELQQKLIRWGQPAGPKD